MSLSHNQTIRCSRCSSQQQFTVWGSINVTVDPNLKKSLLDGTLTTFHCDRCGNEASVVYDILYHDMNNSLAIWLKENDDDDETEIEKQKFSSTTQIKTCRTVRTIHELYDKIKIFDDNFDDFEIELFKFSVCLRQEIDLDFPFYYNGIESSFFGNKSLVFLIPDNGDFRSIKCTLKDYIKTIQPLAEKLRPMLKKKSFSWANLNRNFVFKMFEGSGLIRSISQSKLLNDKIRVHTIGRSPEFDNYQELDEWMFSGSKTYEIETWHIGKDVSDDEVVKHRDPETNDLYVFYKIVNDEWKRYFITRQKFQEIKNLEDC